VGPDLCGAAGKKSALNAMQKLINLIATLLLATTAFG
jgi:hypothetical protein